DPTTLEGSAGRAALRRWLRRYNTMQAADAAMIRIWVDAKLQDETLRADSAAKFDRGLRRLARFLAPRDFGDVEMEAVVMLGLLGAFGSREQPASTIEAATYIIERGLLGR